MLGDLPVRQYDRTVISDQAVAVLGDLHGSFININIGTHDAPPDRAVRLNQVFDTYTIETAHSLTTSGPLPQRGVTSSIQRRWDVKEELGAGIFGEVHREEYTNPQGLSVSRAVKVLRRRQMESLQIDYKRELNALIRLSQPEYHHLFVEFYSWYEHRNSVFIAMEFIPLKDLQPFVKRGLQVGAVKMIAAQILDGIRVMHSLDLVHRDLKSANIFVVSCEPWHVKIGDFGLCKSTLTEQTTLHTSVGTNGYKAPEILGFVAGEKADSYTEKCDMWSYGCILFELLTMRLPFLSLPDLNEFCISGKCWNITKFKQDHSHAWHFVAGLLQPNPLARFDVWQAQNKGSDWFDNTSEHDVHVDVEVAIGQAVASSCDSDHSNRSKIRRIDSTVGDQDLPSPTRSENSLRSNLAGSVASNTLQEYASRPVEVTQSQIQAPKSGSESNIRSDQTTRSSRAISRPMLTAWTASMAEWSRRSLAMPGKKDIDRMVDENTIADPPTARPENHNQKEDVTTNQMDRVKAETVDSETKVIAALSATNRASSTLANANGESVHDQNAPGVLFVRICPRPYPGRYKFSQFFNIKYQWKHAGHHRELKEHHYFNKGIPITKSEFCCIGLCLDDKLEVEIIYSAELGFTQSSRYKGYFNLDLSDLRNDIIARKAYEVDIPHNPRSSLHMNLRPGLDIELAFSKDLHPLDSVGPWLPKLVESPATRLRNSGIREIEEKRSLSEKLVSTKPRPNDEQWDIWFPHLRHCLAINQGDSSAMKDLLRTLEGRGQYDMRYADAKKAVRRWNIEHLAKKGSLDPSIRGLYLTSTDRYL